MTVNQKINKLLAINLNEFNPNFLKKAKKFKCNNILRFLKLKNIKSYTKDKIQNKNLDPWVQNISVNNGLRSNVHKIYNLGESIPKNFNQIWDVVSSDKINTAVWGPMNTKFKNNKYLKIFFPDPWNKENFVKPKELIYMNSFIRAYGQNYTKFDIYKNISKFSLLIFFLIKNGVIFQLLRYPSIFLILFKEGLKSYYLFFLMDIVSVLVFKQISREKNIDFSLIFLNSIAHYQHNYWDDKKTYKNFFILTDILLSIIFDLYKNYDSLIIYNSFSQKKIKPQYIIRPLEPSKFFEKQGVNYTKLSSDMTNGVILSFRNNSQLKKNYDKIKKIFFFGHQLFKINILSTNQLFCKIQVRSKINFNNQIKLKNYNKNYIFYEKKKNFLYKKNKINFKILNELKFIKTTGSHISTGSIYFENIKIIKKNLENIKIFTIIKNYFR